MDLTLCSMFFLFVALLISLPLLFFFFPRTKSGSSKLPPGKTGWPFIGETLEFINTGRRGVPEKFINDRMKKFSPQVFKTSLIGESSAVFCGAAGNKYLFTNENKTVTAWWPRSVYKLFPSSAQSSSNQEAIKMRKMLPGFFKPEALRRYVGIMDTVAKQHFKDNWENHKEVTVFPLSKEYTFALACKLFISVDDPIQLAKFSDPFAILATGVMSIPINLHGTAFNRAIKAANFIRKDLHKIIQQRKVDLAQNKASPTQDILSYMLLTCDENGQFLNELDIADKILGLLVGGHDTASAAITFVVKYLAELPHVYNKVLEEQMEILKTKAPGELLNWDDIQKMKYSWNVACEVMRLAPPVQGAFREAIADFTYAGFSIPKGWKLYWSTSSTHGNPDYFPEPGKFEPSRFEGKGPIPYTYVPFGGGPRMCPGKEFARLEILVFMHNVVTKFKWQKVIPHEKIVVAPMPMPANDLPIRLQLHVI